MTERYCPNDAGLKFLWPGDGNDTWHFVCRRHGEWAKKIAEALGFKLQIVDLENELSLETLPKCQQIVGAK